MKDGKCSAGMFSLWKNGRRKVRERVDDDDDDDPVSLSNISIIDGILLFLSLLFSPPFCSIFPSLLNFSLSQLFRVQVLLSPHFIFWTFFTKKQFFTIKNLEELSLSPLSLSLSLSLFLETFHLVYSRFPILKLSDLPALSSFCYFHFLSRKEKKKMKERERKKKGERNREREESSFLGSRTHKKHLFLEYFVSLCVIQMRWHFFRRLKWNEN